MPASDALHEERAISLVRERLRARFGERPADVEDAIDEAVKSFAGARIRDYVPLLVERISREKLDHRFTAH